MPKKAGAARTSTELPQLCHEFLKAVAGWLAFNRQDVREGRRTGERYDNTDQRRINGVGCGVRLARALKVVGHDPTGVLVVVESLRAGRRGFQRFNENRWDEVVVQLRLVSGEASRTTEKAPQKRLRVGRKPGPKPTMAANHKLIMQGALATHHRLNADDERNMDPADSKRLAELTGLKGAQLSRAIKTIFPGGMKEYRRACISGQWQGLAVRIDDGGTEYHPVYDRPIHTDR